MSLTLLRVAGNSLGAIAVVYTTALVSNSAIASEVLVTTLETLELSARNQHFAQIVEYSQEGDSSEAPVTSVFQRSDVQPTDWAFQALQQLIERYGCIAGYPNQTFQGNRPLTRYEFAIGLNACLKRVRELMAQRLLEVAIDEDLAIAGRLQAEFAAELATLRDRVDTLEAYTAKVEANQFSTTTKLNSEVIFSVAGVLAADDTLDTNNGGVTDGSNNSRITFSAQAHLELNTSFTGDDELTIAFEAGNIKDFASDPIGLSFSGNTKNRFVLEQLLYDFPLGDRLQISIGFSGTALDDFVTSTISPFDNFDSDGSSGSLSEFGFPRQYSLDPGNIGVGANLKLTDNLILDVGYSAGEGNRPRTSAGLFKGNYAAIGQLTFLSNSFDAALSYVHSYSADGFLTDSSEVANTYGAQVNFRPSDRIEIGGGLAYVNTTQIGVQNAIAWSYQITLAFPDLGKEGNLLGILAGVPLYSRDLLPVDDTGFLVEGFYQYRLTDNITITPGIIYIADPFNNNDNRNTVIGAMRTTFSF